MKRAQLSNFHPWFSLFAITAEYIVGGRKGEAFTSFTWYYVAVDQLPLFYRLGRFQHSKWNKLVKTK